MSGVLTGLRRCYLFMVVYLAAPLAYHTPSGSGVTERVAPLSLLANHVQDTFDLVALDQEAASSGTMRNATAAEAVLTMLLVPSVLARAMPLHTLAELIEDDWRLLKDNYLKSAIARMTYKTSWWRAMDEQSAGSCTFASYALATGAFLLPFSFKKYATLVFSAVVFYSLGAFLVITWYSSFRPSPQLGLALLCAFIEYYKPRAGSFFPQKPASEGAAATETRAKRTSKKVDKAE
jgi:hypothetical protein